MSEEEDSATLDISESGVSLQGLLAQAIKSEIEAAKTYRNLLDKNLPERARPKVKRLVTQEEEHEEKLRTIFEDFFPDEEIPLPERSGVEVPSEIARINAPKEIIEKAMETERESEKFYSQLIKEFDDREVRRLLGYLAANEREHYEILKVERDKLE
ncbi:MAG: ferritin family protein [Candidatus Bipolaricaulota bacterium]